MPHITDRFYSRRWGVFNHYLSGVQNGSGIANTAGLVTDWNECTRALDVKRLADNLEAVGAGYYFFTLMQGNEFMAAPNSVFDEIAGTTGNSPCSERDLPLEIGIELKKRGIDFYLYYTGDGPYKNPEFGNKFGFVEPRKDVSMPFVERWASVLAEYAARYGDLVSGWWIDGCYRSAFGYNDALLRPYYDACKAGNSNALVALNDGVYEGKAVKNFVGEDFVCGEFNDFTYIPPARFIEGAQAHILAPLGLSSDGSPWNAWAKPGVKRDGSYMRDYVNRVHLAGGVTTIDVILYRDGSFDPTQLNVLKAINS